MNINLILEKLQECLEKTLPKSFNTALVRLNVYQENNPNYLNIKISLDFNYNNDVLELRNIQTFMNFLKSESITIEDKSSDRNHTLYYIIDRDVIEKYINNMI